MRHICSSPELSYAPSMWHASETKVTIMNSKVALIAEMGMRYDDPRQTIIQHLNPVAFFLPVVIASVETACFVLCRNALTEERTRFTVSIRTRMIAQFCLFTLNFQF